MRPIEGVRCNSRISAQLTAGRIPGLSFVADRYRPEATLREQKPLTTTRHSRTLFFPYLFTRLLYVIRDRSTDRRLATAKHVARPRRVRHGHSAMFTVLHRWGRDSCNPFSSGKKFQFGSPNDEALGGHPLIGLGLKHYQIHRIDNSPWLAELEQRNAIHPRHDKRLFIKDAVHYVFTFQDSTLECIVIEGPFWHPKYTSLPRSRRQRMAGAN